jgi:amino acid transporter
MIGWFYLGATLLTITAVAFTLPQTLCPLFGWPLDAPTEVKIALGAIVLTTVLNIAGVRVLSLINNIGVVAEMAGMAVFAVILLIIGHHQGLGIFFDPAGTQHTPGEGAGYLGTFLLAMFMSLFVVYGFDTAGTLGEETVDPTRRAPQGILYALGLSAIVGFLFLGAAILAIKDVPAIMKSATPLPDIITGAFGTGWGNVYLTIVSIAIFVCLLSIQAAGIRLVFSMSRDQRLPLAGVWAMVHPNLGTPIWAALITGAIASLPLIVSQQIAVIAGGATGLIYLSYFLTNAVLFRARTNGWPQRTAWFGLGRWAMPVNVLALLYGGAMIVNFAWFRPATNPTLGSAFSDIANWPLVGGAPIFELSVALLLIVGGAYWFAVQRHRVVKPQVELEPEPEPVPA